MKALRERYDALLQPWLGGASSSDVPPDPEVDRLLAELSPLLEGLYTQALAYYRASLDEQSGLDFDDLEAGTVALLRNPAIRAHWQAEVAAVLVDEFQDTNDRQREIILGLCGEQPGRLFVVGDARQSIYRFRGADVTVFTGLQSEIQRQGGRSIDLDRTFRAHPALLSSTGALLSQVMGSTPDAQRPYYIPFSPLRSERDEPRPGVQGPFVECILAAGEDSETARAASAHALAGRLAQLKEQKEILKWDEVALLFRASTPFPIYEQALEDFGIPFVTVAGSGFYDRPEVRDLLNILRALADPWDDQALAGMLRSPALGISDVGLYQLRLGTVKRSAPAAGCAARGSERTVAFGSRTCPARARDSGRSRTLSGPPAGSRAAQAHRGPLRLPGHPGDLRPPARQRAPMAQRGQADQRRPEKRRGAGAGLPGIHRHDAGCGRARE